MHEIHPAYLRQLASAAESRSVDGALAVRTGIASNTENGVVSTAARLEPEVIADLLEWLAIVRDCGWFDDVEPARRLYEGLGYEGLYLAEHGAASAFFAPATVLLNTAAVRPRIQRRGIGRSLTLARLRDARARGCTSAILAPSPDGRKLYASLGFRTEPQPPGYWFYLPNRSSSRAAPALTPVR